MADPDIFALLVNPRDGEPYYAEIADRETVRIYTLDDLPRGEGYFHGRRRDDYGQSATVTGLPRVHTPAGVQEKGRGAGTVLYAALCAAAHRENEGKLSAKVGTRGDGVSSNEHRSAFATAWWTNARERYGLVERVTGCAESEFEEEIDDGAGIEVTKIVASRLNADPDSVELSEYAVKAVGTYERCGIKADAFPWERAERHGLVLAFIIPGSTHWHHVTDEDIAEVVSLEAVLAVNLGVLHDRKRYQADEAANIAESLIGIAGNAGATERQLDAMRARYALGLDIDDAATWKHPDFTTYLPEGVRKNPSKPIRVRTPEGTLVTTTQAPRLAKPRVVPTPVPKFYGTRRNPGPDPGEVSAELKRLQDARVKLGWGIYAAQKNAP